MHITRRQFLRSGAATLGALPLTGMAFEQDPRSVAAGGRRPTLVVVFLRGAMDGLNLIVPYGEDEYRRLRPQLAIPRPGERDGALDLDGFFGLHPAAVSLLPFFERGTAVALHGVGHPANTRSHFEEQDRFETAVDDVQLASDGWLNRHLMTSRGRGHLRAIALGDRLPRSLRGEARALTLRGLDDFAFPGDPRGLGRTIESLEEAYAAREKSASGGAALVGRRGLLALEALRHLEAVTKLPYSPSVSYPDTDMGRRCRELARLVRADVGLEVVELDLEGWDTHQNQGSVRGAFADKVRVLSEALAALLQDLEEQLDDVLVVTLTEFGRTAAQNGTGGTDHGWASCALAFGGAVLRAGNGRARKVIGDWPGLGREELNQGRDLAHTTDVRDVYAELLGFLGNSPSVVLPGYDPKPVGLLV